MDITPFLLPEIEEAVLGALLIEKKAFPLIAQTLRAEMFYHEREQELFAIIEEMYRNNEPVDILTVKDALQKKGKLKEAGGAYQLTMLSGRVASSAHIEKHAALIKDYFLRRELIKGIAAAAALSEDPTYYTEDALNILHQLIESIEADCLWTQQLRPMQQLMTDTLTEAVNRIENSKNGVTGIPTGLVELDRKTSGWQPGDLNIIAARPSVGKTALGLFFAKAAAKAGYKVVFYSIEMQGERLGDRWIVAESGIAASEWKNGTVNATDMEQARQAAGNLAKLSMHVDDSSRMSMDYIRAGARTLRNKGLCDIVFIDYLQLAEMTGTQPGRNREQEVAQATRKAKLMAKELNCPVVLLSQLNRESEGRQYKKPALADLRESGSIEQDADMVMLLYRPALAGLPTDRESGFPSEGLGIIIVAKHRNGETGNVYFGHNRSMTGIGDYTPPMEYMMRHSK